MKLTKREFWIAISVSIFGLLQWYLFNSICPGSDLNSLLCNTNIYDPAYNISSILVLVSLVFAVLLVPFIFTLFFSSNVFESWKKFAVWAIPVTLVLSVILMIGGEGNSYFSFGFGPFILAVLYGAYFVISLVVIGVAALRKR